MTQLVRSEFERQLLQGTSIEWNDGGRTTELALQLPESRRLFGFLLKSNTRSPRSLEQTFIQGLAEAFVQDNPAETATEVFPGMSSALLPSWRIKRIETEGFGGVNLWGGPTFVWDVDGESVVLDGPNGSGKSSLIGALTWCFSGERIREAGLSGNSSERKAVFDNIARAVGTWPPLACYPENPSELATNPYVRVSVTLISNEGDDVIVQRVLRDGQVSNTPLPVSLPPILIETGILMPVRLPHIRLDAKETKLVDAVQMLTGYDEVALLGDLVAGLVRKNGEYLSYAVANGRPAKFKEFEQHLASAKAELDRLQRDLPTFVPSDTKDKTGAFALLGRELVSHAEDALLIIKGDLYDALDLSLAVTQRRVATCTDAAREDFGRGLSCLTTWQFVKTANESLGPEQKAKLADAIQSAKDALLAAVAADEKSVVDNRSYLKAVAAAWHRDHCSGPVEACPLCEQDLEELPELKAQLEAAKTAGEAAQRKLRDNLNAIRTGLQDAIPNSLLHLQNTVKESTVAAGLQAEARRHFVEHERYSTVLTGLARIMEQRLLSCPLAEPESVRELELPQAQGVEAIRGLMTYGLRCLSVSDWWSAHHDAWEAWWDKTMGSEESEDHEAILHKLTELEAAITNWVPYDNAAKHLRNAFVCGKEVDALDKEQGQRQAIADALNPLKDLRKYSEAQTRQAIEGLSSRMGEILSGIYSSERLKFASANFEKNSGFIVRGAFSEGIVIDASLVANTSWMRALLWAYLFAIRSEAIDQLGEDRFPVLLLDDPQSTFDLSHRLRWIHHLTSLQNASQPLQIVLATHDEAFLRALHAENFSGRTAHLSAARKEIGCVFIVEQALLEKRWAEVLRSKQPAESQDFIAATRVHTEGMLKLLLQGEAGVANLTMSKLKDRLKELHHADVSPYRRNEFKHVFNLIGGNAPSITYLEKSHHTEKETLTYAHAEEVEKFWRKSLEPALTSAFRALREYRLVHGESKMFHTNATIIEFPGGRRDVVREIPMTVFGRAAALTNGRAADGAIEISQLEAGDREVVVLGAHDAFRLSAATLEPVARRGDILLVSEYATVLPGALVVVAYEERLLARRLQVADAHKDIAVLTAQAINPMAIAAPIVTHLGSIHARKIIGVLFDAAVVPEIPECEAVECESDAAVTQLVKGDVGLFQVSGHSAQPHALDGQFLLVPIAAFEDGVQPSLLDGKPVLAADSDGHTYFKRLRCLGDVVCLESLHGAEEFPPILLPIQPGNGTHLQKVLPVLGVLFERPSA